MLTTDVIESAFIRHAHNRLHAKFVAPRVSVKGWWECDVLTITNSGYWAEYEIKVSKADFRNDFKKHVRRSVYGVMNEMGIMVEHDCLLNSQIFQRVWFEKTVSKHTLLASKDSRCPKTFWYIVPDGLLDPSEIPEYAGLIYAKTKTYRDREYIDFDIIKNAPQNNSTKLTQEKINEIHLICSKRYMWQFINNAPVVIEKYFKDCKEKFTNQEIKPERLNLSKTDCLYCNGTGEVSHLINPTCHFDPLEEPEYETEGCEECGGTGKCSTRK